MGTKTNTVAKPSSVEIIPSTELTGIEGAIRNLSVAESRLTELRPKAESIVVDSPAKFLEGGALLKEIRDLKKAGSTYMKPFKDIVKRATDYLRNKETAHELVAAQIEGPLAEKLAKYQREERERADKEQRELQARNEKAKREQAEADRKAAKEAADKEREEGIAKINAALKAGTIGKREANRMLKEIGAEAEAAKVQADLDAEAAKAAPAPVQKVLPNTPAVSGLRRRLKWEFTVTDANKLKREYLMPNDVVIGQLVRGTPALHEGKTPAEIKALIEETCPGIKVEYRDAI